MNQTEFGWRVWSERETLLRACRDGELDDVKALLDLGFDMHVYSDLPFREACEAGQLHVVKFLWGNGRVDLHAQDHDALKKACRNSHVDVVRFLSAVYDTATLDDIFRPMIAWLGLDVIQSLLESRPRLRRDAARHLLRYRIDCRKFYWSLRVLNFVPPPFLRHQIGLSCQAAMRHWCTGRRTGLNLLTNVAQAAAAAHVLRRAFVSITVANHVRRKHQFRNAFFSRESLSNEFTPRPPFE